MFVEWAKSYFMKEKKVPETIIIYLEGMSSPQTLSQLRNTTVPALLNMIKIIGEKTKTKDYKPELMIVVANKKINTRFFEKRKHDYYNPQSGSVIIEPLSTDGEYDFYLASQYVSQGTCTPTQFKVAYDTTTMPQ